jgi:hypothetical protein
MNTNKTKGGSMDTMFKKNLSQEQWNQCIRDFNVIKNYQLIITKGFYKVIEEGCYYGNKEELYAAYNVAALFAEKTNEEGENEIQ